MKRNYYLNLFLILFISVSFISLGSIFTFLSGIDKDKKDAKEQKEKFEKEEEEILSPDKPDKAAELEFLKTRDLATNTVPKERLIDALKYTQQLQANPRNNAIPGITWNERGPNNVGGRTRAILVDKNDTTGKTVFAGGVGGGLWKTNDITQLNPNWVKADDFFSNIAISCIVQSQSNPQVIYFGTGEGWYNIDAIRGLGIWKSINGGANWTQLSSTNNSNFYYVNKIAIHPVTGDLFAATRNNGLMRSQDGGNSWSQVLGPPTTVQIRACDVVIAADNSIYAAMGGVIWTDGIYKSTNNGNSWTMLNTTLSGFPPSGFGRLTLATAKTDAQRLYVIAQNTVNYGILGLWKSTNGGATYLPISLPADADPQIANDYTRSQAWYDLPCSVDPNNADIVYVGGIDLFKSTNAGSSWLQFSHWTGSYSFQYVHADQHAIVFRNGNSDEMLFGNDGGVFYSSNGTALQPVLRDKDAGYNVTQFYGCAIHPAANTPYFLAGAQDNGSQQFTTAGINATNQASGGDGGTCHIDQANPMFQWTSYVYNNYFTSTDGGQSFTQYSFNNSGQFIEPTAYDDSVKVMYCGNTAGTYFRWNDPQTGTTTDSVTVSAFGTGLVTAVKVSLTTRNRVFFGLTTGKIVRVDSANSGMAKNGVDISSGLPAGYVSCVETQPGNDNHILVTYSNYGINSVWESNNGGASWTSVEGNIPDMPVRWIIFSPLNYHQALVATELGVWSTDSLNGPSTVWGPSNNGLANVSTYMIQYRASDKFMIAATHGRGLFSTGAFSLPAADFASDRRVSYTGKNIQFIDNSTQATSWLWNFGDGNTSNQQNPQHMYGSAGLYNITLTINGGASTKVKNNYIKIEPNKGTPYLPADGGNFDINPNDFLPDNIVGTAFERGNSTISGKNGIHSGSFAWVTGLNEAQYQNGTTCMLYSPNYNFTAAGTYTIKFWAKFSTECAWDGFRIEATTDKGDSWNYVGTVGANWYDFPNSVQNTVFPVNEPYFSCLQPNYTQYFSDVPLAGHPNVGFRVVFKSDLNNPDIGLAMDDWEIDGPVNGLTSSGNQNAGIPKEYKLSQNYPNPFNPSTVIKYQIPKNGFVSIKIYDILGREVKELVMEFKQAGYYEISFDGTNLASGVYFYRINANSPGSKSGTSFTDTKKMLMVK